MIVRTRFAPSPTGTPDSVHLGFIIRALWNFAFAKKNDGQFILRLEDTDRKRSNEETEATILSTLKQYGINWDEGPDIGGPYGPYKQSQRLGKYQTAAESLIKTGAAYYDFDAVIREKEEIEKDYLEDNPQEKLFTRPKARNMNNDEVKDRLARGDKYVVRVKIPENRSFRYHDCILKKDVVIESRFVPDLILLKSDGFPTYHLAVVVDDIDMKISHVFRGQEWISTTPIHLFLYESLGAPIPEIGHFTVILDPRTGKKFSKRDLTALFGAKRWQNEGYLNEAILNYLMLLGWAPKDNREIYSLTEFIQAFDLSGAQKANPIFNPKKLDWFNQQYLKSVPEDILAEKVAKFSSHSIGQISPLLPLVRDRMVTIKDFDLLTDYFFSRPNIPNPMNFEIVKHAASCLEKNFDGKYLEEKARGYCSENNIKVGDYFMNLRIAVTGKTATPPLWEVMNILGKEETIQRLKAALE